MHPSHPDHDHPGHFHRPDHVKEKLYVITPIFNPIRFRSRWKLYKDFENYVLSNDQAELVTIECSFGHREFAIKDELTHRHKIIHVNTKDELWLKENLINVAATRLPSDWKYVAWVDADVTFARPDWVGETIQQLQHYDVIQMWSQFQDVTPNFEIIGGLRSFMDCYINGGTDSLPGVRKPLPALQYGKNDPVKQGAVYPGAPGLAWAMTKTAWNHLGGLIDISILGACDWYMAHALIGKLETVLSKQYYPAYRELLFEWENRAERFIKHNVGVMKGMAIHHWHGPKVNRQYGSREQILIKNQFNPDTDLKKDWQGVYQLTDYNIKLRDDIRAYFRQRNEDALS